MKSSSGERSLDERTGFWCLFTAPETGLAPGAGFGVLIAIMDGDAFQSDCPGCRELAKRLEAAEAKVEALAKRNDELLKLIDELRRGGKRQASPFSKRPPKRDPKRPGRKPGDG